MNARMRKAYESYHRSYMYDLWDAYGRFSPAKSEAWEYCKRLCKKHDGYGLKVIGANTSQFSAGFLFMKDGKEMFMYITKDSDTVAEV